MSMYAYDVSFYDYGFSDPAITSSLFGNPIAAAIDYEDERYARRRPPMRHAPPANTPSTPPEHRHDGTSPLPLGMDWSLPPRIWEGRNSVWPHDSHKKWSYCVTIPSWTIVPSASNSDTVFFRVQVGIQSPEGITSTREVLRRFNEFFKLYSELKKEFPKKNLPPAPPRRFMKIRSKTLLEERRCALEVWMEKLLSDIGVSRTAQVAIFLELEASARQSCSELNLNESAANSVLPSDQIGSSSSITSHMDNDSVNETSDVNSPRSTHIQLVLEELTTKYMELEFRLTIAQEAKAYAESVTATTIQQNEMLLKQLDDAQNQVEFFRKQRDGTELQSKSDVKVLAKEVKSLRTSHSELKQKLSRCLEEKAELEKEKQKWEAGNALKDNIEDDASMKTAHNDFMD